MRTVNYTGYKKAFTLAEVLVTLAIIGVVAALTIPSLAKNIQDAQFKAAWKKSYSVLDQATRLVMLNHEGSLMNVFTNDEVLRDNYSPFLKHIKSCRDGEEKGICWHADDGTLKYFNGDLMPNGANNSGVVLNNGSFLRFYAYSSTCDKDVALLKVCGILITDVNGFKGPNTLGRDVFYTHILKDGIKPYGIQGSAWENRCKINPWGNPDYGYGCAAEYLKE